MAKRGALEEGREAFKRREWQEAFRRLSRIDGTELGAVGYQQLGDAAYLIGRDDDAVDSWTRAHTAFVAQGDPLPAARIGFWLSLTLLLAGKGAQGSGWLARTQRLIAGREGECAEHGFALVITGLMALGKGDAEKAAADFGQATTLAERFGDHDLLAVSVLGRGQALIKMQRIDEGVTLLDEAMVTVTSGTVSAPMAGIVYCAVILMCEQVFDLQRAHEWTVALDRWCGEQPELVAYRGMCRVHRAEVMQLRGEWPGALEEARRAQELLSARSKRSAGRAIYQQAELHRLRGELERAEEVYREAGVMGFEPQPGVSLLRLAQGDAKSAKASIQRVGSEATRGKERIKVLGPLVEIMLATGEMELARAAADELAEIAREVRTPFVTATAAHAMGAVLVALSEPENALGPLREAWTSWQQLDAPYNAARVRVLIARACELLGDGETARMHIDAAALVFDRLGATPDLARLQGRPPATSATVAELSKRERQVLSLVAAGKTNRQIAGELGISEHTVARHISNIFNKIGVSSRTAASAFAFEHDLV